MAITRSEGIELPGWAGPRPGGGYRGATDELDAAVAAAAKALHAEYDCDVEIRFNSDRKSGGAFMRNGVGITCGYLMTREQYEQELAEYPDAVTWLTEPEGDGGQLYHAVMANEENLLHPHMGNNESHKTFRPTGESIRHRYFRDMFTGLEAAQAWVREHTIDPSLHAKPKLFLRAGSRRAADKIERLLVRPLDWHYTMKTGGQLILVTANEYEQIKAAGIKSVTKFRPNGSTPARCLNNPYVGYLP